VEIQRLRRSIVSAGERKEALSKGVILWAKMFFPGMVFSLYPYN
jgi:hypothetical protein